MCLDKMFGPYIGEIVSEISLGALCKVIFLNVIVLGLYSGLQRPQSPRDVLHIMLKACTPK